jgi:hypothetical protein
MRTVQHHGPEKLGALADDLEALALEFSADIRR